MLFSTIVEKDDAFNYVFRFGIIPMMLFSGAFYPTQSLPQWGEVAAWVTPLWHTNELVRLAAIGPVAGTGDSSGAMVLVHAGYLLAFIGIGYALVRRGFSRRLIV